MKIINIKQKKVVWSCSTYQKDIELKKLILCNGCVTWFLVKCNLSIKPKLKKGDWFCVQYCKRN